MGNGEYASSKLWWYRLCDKDHCLLRQLNQDGVELVLTRQLLRCGTSIGANIEEAIGAHTRADFASKMGISYKEAREYTYWMRLLVATGTVSQTEANPLLKDIDELLRIIGAIRQALKNPARDKASPDSRPF